MNTIVIRVHFVTLVYVPDHEVFMHKNLSHFKDLPQPGCYQQELC